MSTHVKTNMGLMPIEDYLDIQARSYGYSSYESLRSDGMTIEVNEKDVAVDVTVFTDTVRKHDDDDNLLVIRVPGECIRRYVKEICKADFESWMDSYTADDTVGLFDFVVANGYDYEEVGYEN